jgi:3-methylcrotonyl-CoA carboxylase alpha subunit
MDTGVRAGDAITPHYDPMIAKVVAAGPDRRSALARLGAALADTQLGGLTTNLPFLRRLVGHPAMEAADLDTGFIARHAATLLPARQEVPAPALAAFAAIHQERRRLQRDAGSPWEACLGFRVFGVGEELLLLRDEVRLRRLVVRRRRGTTDVVVDGGAPIAVATDRAVPLRVALDGTWHRVAATLDGDLVTLTFGGEDHAFRLVDPYAPLGGEAATEGRLSAPIPGRVVHMLVAVGDHVARGQVVAILEAMKTELRITAPADGVVAHLGCAVGDSVEEGTEIVTLAPPDGDASPP